VRRGRSNENDNGLGCQLGRNRYMAYGSCVFGDARFGQPHMLPIEGRPLNHSRQVAERQRGGGSEARGAAGSHLRVRERTRQEPWHRKSPHKRRGLPLAMMGARRGRRSPPRGLASRRQCAHHDRPLTWALHQERRHSLRGRACTMLCALRKTREGGARPGR
jgi:hypothetical protein